MLDLEQFIFVTLVVLPLLYWLYWRRTHRRMLELAALVPGPPALPLLGNALLFLAKPEEQLNKIADLLHKYGQYVRVWLGPDLNIIVKNPADIKFLLTSNKVNKKGPLYYYMAPYIGRGLIAGGPYWRLHRKIVSPSYNKKSVQTFTKIFNDETKELADVLSKRDPEETFNIYFDVVNSTTQCVCQTLMGLSKKDSQNIKRLHELVLGTQSIYTLIFSTMTRWWLQVPLIYWLTGTKKQESYYVKMIDEMTSDIVEKRRKAMESEGRLEDATSVVDRLILEDGDEKHVKLETMSLFSSRYCINASKSDHFKTYFQSQEAAAKIASGLLLFLAHLPEWQKKVYDEVIDVVGDEEDVSEEHLKRLHNLEMVYKEVLRYLPIGAMIQRTVEEEVTINNGKLTLPVGTSLVIPIHDLHRDPQYWDDPGKVMPERFLPENVKKRDPNAFVPFSLGAMDCLGRVYGTALIKTLVVQVVRRVHLEADGKLEDLDLHVAISVKFAKGYNLRARPRNPN